MKAGDSFSSCRAARCRRWLGGVLFAVAVSACAEVLKTPQGWEYSAPPPGDEFLTNRFGRTWSEPIYSGWLLVDDRYVDAPYIVEQRGYLIFVNGVHVQTATHVRHFLPLPDVTKDPGFPRSVTRDMRLEEVFEHPEMISKQKYINQLELPEDARIEAFRRLYASLPCVATVRLRDPETDGKGIVAVDHAGREMRIRIDNAMSALSRRRTDSELHTIVTSVADFLRKSLDRGDMVVSRAHHVVTEGYRDIPPEQFTQVFEVLQSSRTPDEKTPILRALGLLPPEWDARFASRIFPLSQFVGTTQLWQRLRGDASWTHQGAASVQRLTNGWVRSEPAFRRGPAAARPDDPKKAASGQR